MSEAPTTQYRLSKLKTLTEEKSDHPLRTDSMVGTASYGMPKVGQHFLFINTKPLDPKKDYRLVRTSKVERVVEMLEGTPDGKAFLIFETQNSRYMLEELGDPALQN